MPLIPSPGRPKIVFTPQPINRSTNISATVNAIFAPLSLFLYCLPWGIEHRVSLLEYYDLVIKVACIRRKNAQSQVTDEAISHRSHSHAGCTGSTLDDLLRPTGMLFRWPDTLLRKICFGR